MTLLNKHTLIADFIEVNDESGESNLYACSHEFMYTVNLDTRKMRYWKLSDTYGNIMKSAREDILRYRYGNDFSAGDTPSLADIFIHGEYVVEISESETEIAA